MLVLISTLSIQITEEEKVKKDTSVNLGNIKSKNGIAKGYFYDKIISLNYNSDCCIIGRAIVVHKDRDDLAIRC